MQTIGRIILNNPSTTCVQPDRWSKLIRAQLVCKIHNDKFTFVIKLDCYQNYNWQELKIINIHCAAYNYFYTLILVMVSMLNIIHRLKVLMTSAVGYNVLQAMHYT